MSAHTPGPWVLKSWHEAQIVTRDGDAIALVYADKNRALIAAAPELAAALGALLGETLPRDTPAQKQARAALAKVDYPKE